MQLDPDQLVGEITRAIMLMQECFNLNEIKQTPAASAMQALFAMIMKDKGLSYEDYRSAIDLCSQHYKKIWDIDIS